MLDISMFRGLKTHFVLMVICLFSLSGCATVNLISDYDEATDKAVTSVQRKFETFFVELESQIGTDAAAYENHTSFYKEIEVDISAIQLRVDALPKNSITSKQVKLLSGHIDDLKDIHKEGIFAVEVIEPIRASFNTALTSILRLELAKKNVKGTKNEY